MALMGLLITVNTKSFRFGEQVGIMAGLDDLHLDDMFNDDGDNLFEGLDIELDGVGDIISNERRKL